MRNRTALFALAALTVPANIAIADAPQVPTEPPYIALGDNHDEPNNYGFCIDTDGRGQTDLLQSHTCKPAEPDAPRNASNHDTRFAYDPDTLQVVSYPFEGYCMQALLANVRTEFALLSCSDHPRQKFLYQAEDQTLRLNEDPTRCVSVADQTQPAGPWVKRALYLTPCAETDPALMQWIVAAE